jgi:hypothetical protein
MDPSFRYRSYDECGIKEASRLDRKKAAILQGEKWSDSGPVDSAVKLNGPNVHANKAVFRNICNTYYKFCSLERMAGCGGNSSTCSQIAAAQRGHLEMLPYSRRERMAVVGH